MVRLSDLPVKRDVGAEDPGVVGERLAVGGALYSIGAVIYGLRRPDPWPRTFGYHELFHACTAVAAICQYIAMWYAVF